MVSKLWFKKCLPFVLLFLSIIVLGGYRGRYEPVRPPGLPVLFDQLQTAPLVKAVNASLAYYQALPREQQFRICGTMLSAAEQIESLKLFRDITEQAAGPADFWQQVTAQFSFCREPAAGEMLITGYFEPVFPGSLKKKEPYIYPLYGLPPDLDKRKNNSPYWTRAEIEKNDYLAGSELVYLADPLSAFLLHVQGSGKVRLPDGSVRLLRYAGNNGRPYRSIGKLLIDQGKLSREAVDLPAITAYLQNHPQEIEEILHYNQRFIFFRMMPKEAADDSSPPGSMGQPLTPGYSIALDQDCFATGTPALLVTEQPIFNEKGVVTGWQPLCRFVFNQDSGSAIKGKTRADLFLGSGPEAAAAAGIMKQPGKLYFLYRRKNETTGD